MNYLLDERCEISNNAAEHRAKTYVTGRKNFLFHDTADGATASAIVLSPHRNSEGQQPEYLSLSLHLAAVYAGL